MSRIIREHRVYGKTIIVEAILRDDLYTIIRKTYGADFYPWEIKPLGDNKWECYIAEHQSCFALND